MNKKRLVLLVLLFSFSIVGTCLAGELSFNKKFVDSNSWTLIGSAVKDSYGSYGEVRILKMYNANQEEDADYKKLKVKAAPNGEQTLAYKGRWCEVSIPLAYQLEGTSIQLFGMGNDSTLDCYITGYWNVH